MPPWEGEKQYFFKAIQVCGNRSAPKPDIRISVGLKARYVHSERDNRSKM
jgi:hypothetical protein